MLLRDYQIAATEAVFDYFISSRGTPLVVLPTGSGKSICIADLVKHVLKSAPDEHCLILSHRQEILQQNAAKLQSLLPNTPIGIYSQGLGSKRLRQVTVAGVQSLVRVQNLPPFRLIIIDECHLVPPSGEGSYQKIISRLLAAEPDARIVGYSATPFRLGSGYLHEGEDRVFTDICYEVPVIDLVNAGYLAPLVTKHANTQADLSGVAIRGGEFVAGQAEQAMDREELTGSAVAEMLRWGNERKSWLVFCSGIRHAEHVTQELIRAGVNADNLFGNSDKGHRTRVLNNFKNQRLRALVSVDTITTGFDAPCTDMIAFLRPTASAGLWVQALGRGMRISPETAKVNCIAEGQLVLTDHGMIPIEEVTLSMKLWDGCNWVSHDGAVYKGEQEVINYAGLIATADHKVWTQEGWQTFGWCASKQITIAETGIGEQNIRQCQNRYRGDITPHQQRSESCIYSYVLHFLFKKDRTLLCQCNERDGGLSKMWARQTSPTPRTPVALQQRVCRGVSLPQPPRFAIQGLWCAWNPISFCVAHGDGYLGGAKSWTAPRATDRQDRQRRALRTWKPALFDSITESISYPISTTKRYVAHISKKLSKCKICGLYVARIFRKKNDAGRDRTSFFLSSVAQTKRRVWDILNVGPLNRFTVEGLLVSNCLVLDFCGNAIRLGPIDNPRVSQRGGSKSSEGGEAPSKVCPECSTCVATSTRSCVDCGYEWPEPEVIHAPVAYSSPVMSNGEPEIYEVRSVSYKKHSKNIGVDAFGEDKFSYSLRVTYSLGLGFEISEWICFGHEKEFARRQADRWWKQHRRSDDSSVPKTVEEAINRTSELMDVERVTVKRDGKFYRVLAATFRVSAVTESLLEEHGI